MGRSASWPGAVLAVCVRPRLWWVALRQLARTVRPGWWRRPPFLPLPDRAYLHYRSETAYGSRGAPTPSELVTYLEWCRSPR